MDSARFSNSQRLSCHIMNPDLFKPSPERVQVAQPVKPNRNKTEQIKPELAQVVADSKTGRCYCKGKLLGKVTTKRVPCGQRLPWSWLYSCSIRLAHIAKVVSFGYVAGPVGFCWEKMNSFSEQGGYNSRADIFPM
uniref:Uncharacterized protein n=1 Tax=Anguilla anguilla TaxID=7936 RepID=A0A0E9WUE2_ANGAN